MNKKWLGGAFLLLCHCSLFAPQVELRVRLPEFPDHWSAVFGRMGFSIVTIDPDCGQRRILTTYETVCEIVLAKQINLPVLAYPIGAGALPPAGGIYPIDLSDREELCLTWENGPIALLLITLREQGVDPSGFNCRRLAEELASRDDPWNIDMESVGEKMIRGSFRVTDIRPRPSRTSTLPFDSGSWYTESPFRPPQPAGSKGLRLENVTLGYHTLIRDPLLVYALFVGEEEVLWRLWGESTPP